MSESAGEVADLFTTKELGVLARSLLRSLESTPERELTTHRILYERISGEIIRRMGKNTIARAAAAIDQAIGRSSR